MMPKSKKIALTPEQIEEQKAKRRAEYLDSLPSLTKAMSESLPYGLEWNTRLSKKAQKLGLDIIISELKKLSERKEVASIAKGGHIYQSRPESEYLLTDGKPTLMEVANKRGKVETSVVIDRKVPNPMDSKGFVYKCVADPAEFCAVEPVSAGKHANADGYKQIFQKPMDFPTNPEWMGEGYCKCVSENKKMNQYIRQRGKDGVWRAIKDAKSVNPDAKDWAIHCCNGTLTAGAKACKRHLDKSGELKKGASVWTGLGAGWAKQLARLD